MCHPLPLTTTSPQRHAGKVAYIGHYIILPNQEQERNTLIPNSNFPLPTFSLPGDLDLKEHDSLTTIRYYGTIGKD